jgi:hypothetical protein
MTTDHTRPGDNPGAAAGRATRMVIWTAGLLVALAAAVATAHGLYEVAIAARVPTAIAWLYPLITDGLALVAYAASARLTGSAARYAWSVVVLAAGLSGLAQAMFLASDAHTSPDGAAGGAEVGGGVAGPVFEASAVLRFGVGAWPAVAAAIVAHLLYLLATDHNPTAPGATEPAGAAVETDERRPAVEPNDVAAVQPAPLNVAGVQPETPAVQAVTAHRVQAQPGGVHRPAAVSAPTGRPALTSAPVEPADGRTPVSPARDRARAAATRHAHRHGQLPTVSELEAAAEVSRGTASTVLKALREQSTPLHLITTPDPAGTSEDDPTIEEHTQP